MTDTRALTRPVTRFASRRPAPALLAAALAPLLALAGCAAPGAEAPTPLAATEDAAQTRFMAALARHCGKAYAGRLVSSDAADADMAGAAMVVHFRECAADRMAIPFHVQGEGGTWDRSRTWLITRTPAGLRLKHDHRHADGTHDAVTLYGGDTADGGTATAQDFPVDQESIAMFCAEGLTASVTNVWRVEITPATYTYQLSRAGRLFRVEFDLTQPVTPPPAPWGW
ncbi:hypothetical protein [uncultured Erythrobacter sp.]|uniref:hypothetical protein n=1 Tax=uncultured Erythrobacter sp. TaxID=263913 RepID=UPI00265A001E|nr:hypothetical protein [uncultured Erythrobacter sp.]